jgi:hypothetical protein
VKNRYNVQSYYWGLFETNDDSIDKNNVIDKYVFYYSKDITRNINDLFNGIRLRIKSK